MQTKTMKATPQQEKMFELARQSMGRAYSPYSHKKVGACVELDSGALAVGCNIENASYGATVCAERSALSSAVSQFGAQKIRQILVISQSSPPWPPCGLCLQALAEFATPDTSVVLASENGIHSVAPFKEFLPFAFTPDQLGIPK